MALRPESKKFLYDLLTTPSPTGYESRAQKVVYNYVKGFADEVASDLHGNLIATINPKGARRVMLAGHCDQIGFIVNHISNDGFIYLSALGGIDTTTLLGAHVTIYNEKGAVRGIIGKKPIHAVPAEERGKTKVELDKVFVDIGVKNKKEAEKFVAVGDMATFALGVTELKNDLIASPGLDDKVGLFIAMETLRLSAAGKIPVALSAVSTVQEEVGLRGAKTSAYSVDPEVGIAIDVCHANDNPSHEQGKGPKVALGGGPGIYRGPNINPVAEKLILEVAKKQKIPVQLMPGGALLGTDANSMQVSRAGVATLSIGIPNRYMHTQVEVCSLRDLESTAKLLAAFVKSITTKSDFRPLPV